MATLKRRELKRKPPLPSWRRPFKRISAWWETTCLETQLTDLANSLNKIALFELINILTSVAIVWTAITWFREADERTATQRQMRQDEQIRLTLAIGQLQGDSSGALRLVLERMYGDGFPLSGMPLSNADLRNINLKDEEHRAILRSALLDNANLRMALIQRVVLSFASLNEANLTEANLQHANIRHARLKDANLTDANLQHANLRFALLNGANLTGANLSGADLGHAIFDEHTVGLPEEVKSDMVPEEQFDNLAEEERCQYFWYQSMNDCKAPLGQ